MKKTLFLFSSILLLLILILLFKNIIGDLRPVMLPNKSSPTISSSNTNKLPTTNEQIPNSKTKLSNQINIPLKLYSGFAAGVFAQDLKKVRDLEFSPSGTLLASITASGKVVALPDADGDGQADETKTVLAGLDNPHGLAFYDGKLYVAEETQIVRYRWNEQKLEALFDKKLFDLPLGGRHFTRSLALNNKGNMFISIGSTCDVCFEKHPWIGTVVKSDQDGNNPQVVARGLRNAVFITINPQTQIPWVTEMGRDFLGDNLPPDEINIIKEGLDYGWPVCYGNNVHDISFDKNRYDIIGNVKVCDEIGKTPSDFDLPAHSAPLGLTFINSPQFPDNWQGDLLVAYHGSWNRSVPTGYKVVKLDVEGEKILKEEDFVSGFLEGSQTFGRPVDVIFDQDGSLYVSDDKGGNIYKIIKQ